MYKYKVYDCILYSDIKIPFLIESDEFSYKHKINLLHKSSSPIRDSIIKYNHSKKNIGEFFITLSNDIFYNKNKLCSIEDFANYFLHNILASFFSSKNYFLLHAASFEINKKAFAICGPSRKGKSTMLYKMLDYVNFISEDTLLIEEIDSKFYAIPSYPFIKIDPQALNEDCGSLYNFDNDLINRKGLAINIKKMSRKPFQLSSCYFLDWGEKSVIRHIDHSSLFFNLLCNSFKPTPYFSNVGNQELHLEKLQRVANGGIKFYTFQRKKNHISSDIKFLLDHIESSQ